MSICPIRFLAVSLLVVSFIGCTSDSDESATPTNDVAGDVGDDAAMDAGNDDAGADAAPEIGEDCHLDNEQPATPDRVQIENGTIGCDNVLLAPDPGEEGYLAAARLTPPDYPFAVAAIAYPLGHGPSGTVTCNSALSHHVYLFAHDAVAPPAEPTIAVDLIAPALAPEDVSDEGRFVYLELDEPMILTEGEHLFVAVPLLGTHPDVMCISVDDTVADQGDRNYWSSATEPPYTWVRLDSFGLSGNILALASGYVVE